MFSKILPLIIFLLVSVNAESANYFIRDDGGSPTECNGLVNAAKKADKKCAFNGYWKSVTYSATSTDTITIGKGTFVISVQPPDIWIPMSTFVASPLQYINAVKNGRKVFFNELGGVAYELQLRKY